MPRLLKATPAPVPADTIGHDSGTDGMRGSGGQFPPATLPPTLVSTNFRISVNTSSVGEGAEDHKTGMDG